MRAAVFFFVGFLFSGSIIAQDIHFSQYNMSPTGLNPAEVGFFDGDWRIAINYRQQWKSIAKPYKTTAASYDQPIYALPGHFSAGFSVLNDRSGVIGLTNTKTYLSLAYKKSYNTWNISLGLQPGFVLKSYDLNKATFPEQYNDDLGLFDNTLPLSEKSLSANTSYFDLNAGILINRQFNGASLTGGIALLHLNQPNVSYFNNKENLPNRFTAYLRGSKTFSELYFIRPSVLTSSHAAAQEFLIGTDVGTYITDKTLGVEEIYGGIDLRTGFERNGDAFIVSAGVKFRNFHLAMAYDINYSPLKVVTSNRGAFEINLIYISPSSALKRITIPCDRY